jgi:hypothetical protein
MGSINHLNAKLNCICYLLALLGAHHILHVSRIRVKADAELFIDFRPLVLTAVELRVILPVPHTTEAASSQQRNFVRKLIATIFWNKKFSCFSVLL